MQGWRDDKSCKHIKIAKTLKELLPAIKKSLADRRVACVRIARRGKRLELFEIEAEKFWGGYKEPIIN